MLGHKASAFLAVENFGNMLNDEWGVLKEDNFLSNTVTSSINDAGQYSYDKFNNPSSSRVTELSLWEMRLGVKYDFK